MIGLSLGIGLSQATGSSAPLALSPTSLSCAPGGTQTFTATGGSTPYTYSLPTNNSGGSINSTTGAYICGSTGSVSDVVRVTDGSSSVVNATVTVSAALAISPTSFSLAPGDQETFTASGGAGSNVFSISTNNSGGSINSSSGLYTAGATPATDTVRVTDANSKTSNATVSVSSVTLSPLAPTVIAGHTQTFTASGGAVGAYVYSISTNNSGGSINSSTGDYTAGSTAGVTDTIKATDILGAFGTTTAAVSATIVAIDFTALAKGDMSAASFLSATGLTFTRSSDGHTVQDTASTWLNCTAGNDRPRVGKDGFVFEETRANKLGYCRDFNTATDTGQPQAGTSAVIWGNATGASDTISIGDAAGPDGTAARASRHQVASNNRSGFCAPAFSTAGTYSGWMKAASGSNQNGAFRCTGNTDEEAGSSTLSTTWARYVCASVAPFGGTANCFINDGRASTLHSVGVHARDVHVDGLQFEQGKYPTELIITSAGSAVTRAGEHCEFAAGSTICDTGDFGIEIKFVAKAATTEDNGAIRQLLFQDANNQVWIDTSNQINFKLGGATTQTLATAMTWARGDTVEIFVQAGSATTTAAYRVNGGSTTQLGTHAAFGSFTPSGAMHVFCSSATLQLTASYKTFNAYAKGQKASWA